jgi:NADH-quinone oxidoreductase subunit C
VLDNETCIRTILEKFPGSVEALELQPAQNAIKVAAEKVHELFEFLVENPDFKMNYLSSIAGVDKTENIEIVYHVSSLESKIKLTVKAVVARSGGSIDSIQDIIPSANWFEREIWELFGVEFNGHPNLTRFLLADDWDQGNPMLRDWDGPDFVRMPEVN